MQQERDCTVKSVIITELFPDDICLEIMKWLNYKENLLSTFLISKQWFRVGIERCKFQFNLSHDTVWKKFMVCSKIIQQKPSYFPNIESLEICYNSVDDVQVKTICLMTGLTKLVIRGNKIKSKGAELISKSLKQLTILDIGSNRISVDGAKFIGSSLEKLTELDVSGGNNIGLEGVKSIGSLSKLTKLYVDYNNEAGIAEIVGGTTQLRQLGIGGCQIGAESMKFLSPLTNLIYLRISSNDIGSDGAKVISSLPNIQSLFANSCSFGEEGCQWIGTMKQLECLEIGENQIGDQGAQYLSSLSNLRELNCSNNEINSEGSKYIGMLSELTELDIGGNDIENDGVQYLALNCKKLNTLSIAECGITDDGILHLLSSSSTLTDPIILKELTYLDLSDNTITDAGAKHISTMKQLKQLVIGIDHIGKEGLSVLKSMTHLEDLDLRQASLSIQY